MKYQLSISENLYEDKSHGNFPFPMEIGIVDLSLFDQGLMACHWHPELEFAIVLSGIVEYQVNDKVHLLKAGEGLFINAGSLHTARAHGEFPGIFQVFVFNPVMIYGYAGSAVQTKYIDPILDASGLTSHALSFSVPWQQNILRTLAEIRTAYENLKPAYELQIQNSLGMLWFELYQAIQDRLTAEVSHNVKELQRLKDVLGFIHSHYDEKLTLPDIAGAGNISTSECCRFFKRLLRQTPFEYLLRYRIDRSLPLLMDPALSITDIAVQTGFSGASYYTEIFKRIMHMAPRDYRKKMQV